jgi:hypothetical protein
MGSYLTERVKIVGCLAPSNIGSAYSVSQPVKLDFFQKATILLYYGALDGPRILVVYKGNTSTVNTAMAFNYSISNGAAAYVQLSGDFTAATNAGITISNTTYPTGSICAIEINGADLGSNYHFVGVNVGANGTTNLASYMTILSDARNPEAVGNMATVIA